jgi:rhomboid family GlyGly-CTERM serine protease
MRPDGPARQVPVPGRRQAWAWISALALVQVALWLPGEDFRQLLRYDRTGLEAGEYWRVLTGHFVHGNLQHLSLNVAGLGLLGLLFHEEYRPRDWFLIGLGAVLAIGAGLWWLNPEVHWYVGLSGVLHGALAAGAFAWWFTQPRLLAIGLTALLLFKLGWEQFNGSPGLAGDMPVIVDAHLYGAIGGLVAAALALKAGKGVRG